MVIHIIPSFSNTPITVHHTKWASMFTQNLKFIEIWTIRFTLLYNVAFLNGRFICKYSSVYFVHVRLLYRRPKVLVFSFICFRVNHAEDNQWKLIENILRRHPCIIGGRNPYSWKDITDGKQFLEIEKKYSVFYYQYRWSIPNWFQKFACVASNHVFGKSTSQTKKTLLQSCVDVLIRRYDETRMVSNYTFDQRSNSFWIGNKRQTLYMQSCLSYCGHACKEQHL